MQTSIMDEFGLSEQEIVEECRKAGGYRQKCVQSLGRDLGNDARDGDYSYVAGICSRLEQDLKESCIAGVAYALADYTWDGQYVFRFCSKFKGHDASYCYNISSNYLAFTLLNSPENLLDD